MEDEKLNTKDVRWTTKDEKWNKKCEAGRRMIKNEDARLNMKDGS